jgi:hypothetical protein
MDHTVIDHRGPEFAGVLHRDGGVMAALEQLAQAYMKSEPAPVAR